MKPASHFSSLLYFNLKTILWVVWFMCGFVIADTFYRHPSGYGMFNMTLSGYPIPMFSLLLGVMFYNDGKALSPIPHREFLFSRPVPRGDAWLTRNCLYFTFILAAPVISLCLALHSPDLAMSVYHSDNEHFTGEKLALYHAAFPGSTLVHEHGSSTGTLAIPQGRLFLACWLLLEAVLAAQVAQMLSLLSAQAQKKSSFVLFGGLVLVVLYSQWHEINVEPVFLMFARHWCFFAVAAVGATLTFQRFARKRTVEMDVI